MERDRIEEERSRNNIRIEERRERKDGERKGEAKLIREGKGREEREREREREREYESSGNLWKMFYGGSK